jgi:phage baseplate assembly protein W
MAIEIQKPALDFETDVAIGIDLPMGGFVGSQFQLNYATIDQAVANAKNLLLTNHGERPMRPLWGCNLRASLFENNTDEFIADVEETIRTNFEAQLPYINIADLQVARSETNPNQVTITLSINLIGNEFDTRQVLVTIDNEQE